MRILKIPVKPPKVWSLIDLPIGAVFEGNIWQCKSSNSLFLRTFGGVVDLFAPSRHWSDLRTLFGIIHFVDLEITTTNVRQNP